MLRGLLKNPGFSLIVIGLLALGIGVNTAMFSIIDRVLLHPFPFRDLDRMVQVVGTDDRSPAPEEAKFIAGNMRSFEANGYWTWRSMVLTGIESADSIFALEVTPGLFEMLGVPPHRGRIFSAKDYDSSAPPVAVISDRLWRKDFAADPGIIGRQILLDGAAYTVIGVMGPEFVLTSPAHQVWLPYKLRPDIHGELHRAFTTVARLRPGVSIRQAQQEMDAIRPGLPANPDRDAKWRVVVRPFTEEFVGAYRQGLMLLWGAVGLVLLIACANAANLLLVRASERRREFAIRASLGASRWTLMRYILGETLALGIAGGVAGLALAWALIRLLVALFPRNAPVPRLDAVTIDPATLAIAIGLVLVTAALCAIPACVSLGGSDLASDIHAASRTASSGRGANRTRSALLAFEVGLSVMLLMGAGLMLHSLDRLLNIRLGFDPEHVLVASVSVPAELKTRTEMAYHYTELLTSVRSLPGVVNAGISTVLPFGGLVATSSITVEGVPDSGWRSYSIYLREVSPGYFPSLGIRLLRGRDFNAGDTATSQPVVIVSEELAHHYWPGQDPVGKRVGRSDNPAANGWATVIGVVENIKHRSLRTGADAELYLPYTQSMIGAKYTYLVLRAHGDPLGITNSLRRRVHDVDPGQPVTEVQKMRTLVTNAAAGERFHALLLETFAALALGMAVAGIFAVVAYTVVHRRREIGIRSALGATPRDVIRFVAAIAMRPAAIGALAGIAAGLPATRLLRAELFETTPADPLVLSAVIAILMVTALIAACIPAWRAGRIDPAEVLRAE